MYTAEDRQEGKECSDEDADCGDSSDATTLSWGGDAEIRASVDAYTTVDAYDLLHTDHDGGGQPKVGDSLPIHIGEAHQQVEDSESCLGQLVLGVEKVGGVVNQSQQVELGGPMGSHM